VLKRNRHLLQELFARLPEADSFIIPWAPRTCRDWPGKFKKPVSSGGHTRLCIHPLWRQSRHRGGGWIPR